MFLKSPHTLKNKQHPVYVRSHAQNIRWRRYATMVCRINPKRKPIATLAIGLLEHPLRAQALGRSICVIGKKAASGNPAADR